MKKTTTILKNIKLSKKVANLRQDAFYSTVPFSHLDLDYPKLLASINRQRSPNKKVIKLIRKFSTSRTKFNGINVQSYKITKFRNIRNFSSPARGRPSLTSCLRGSPQGNLNNLEAWFLSEKFENWLYSKHTKILGIKY